MSQGLGAGQGDAVLLAVVEGGDGAELGVQLDEEVVEGAHPLDVGKVAQAVKLHYRVTHHITGCFKPPVDFDVKVAF